MTTDKKSPMTQQIQIAGTIGKLNTKTFGNDNRMVARGRLEYFTKSTVNTKREHNSRIELEFWDDLGALAMSELREGTKVIVTGELFQRRWDDDLSKEPRSMHRINVSAYTIQSSPITAVTPKKVGRFAKFASK